MDYFPFFVKLSQFKCLMIGGGDIALNKANLLLQAKINLTLVAKKIQPELKDLLDQHGSIYYERAFTPSDINSSDIIIVATDDEPLNETIWKLAKAQNKWVNVVDDQEKCDFIFPALVKRDDLTVAISTAGVAPTIASWLRSQFEQTLPQQWSTVMQVLKIQKKSIRKNLPDVRLRRRFYRSLIDNLIPQWLKQQTTESHQKLEDQINRELQDFNSEAQKTLTNGKVYLVGSGPGDPELMTIRTQQILQQADVVLYDRLIGESLLDYTRRDAKKVFVGKAKNNHHKTQDEINELLLSYAKKGNIVVRLKGGDPFIFARGGEEMHFLQENGFECDIVPGVSAVNGVAASLGIPLTLRGVSDKLLFTSVYADQKHKVDWQQLALPRQTLVFYMGLQNLQNICLHLIKHNLPQSTPIALVEKGTWREQKVIYSTVKAIADGQIYSLNSPVLTIIGDVINHRRIKKGKP